MLGSECGQQGRRHPEEPHEVFRDAASCLVKGGELRVGESAG